MTNRHEEGLSRLEYHVLLALARAPLYGYAVKEAVEEESGGVLTPGAGSLYRVLARLLGEGVVEEADPPADLPPHPGRARKYYALTPAGRALLADEAGHLRAAAALARERLGMAEGGA